jgi:hypothetical protein
MNGPKTRALLLLAPLVLIPLALRAPGVAEMPPPAKLAQATAGAQHFPGFVPFYWDRARGRILLELNGFDAEFLYLDWLATGVGNNDLGLDRGQPGETRVVTFQRHGPKVFLVQANQSFRAASKNPDERRAAAEAFAQSVLWGFAVVAEGDKGEVLVDATDFFLRDARDVVGELRRKGQGTFKLEPSRCAVYLPRTKNFPRNTEVEATVTLTSDAPGPLLDRVAPHPAAVTVRQHHSFIQLPDGDYRQRAFDPRAGYFFIDYLDFAVPLGEPLRQRRILRHRLRRKDPAAARGEPVRPLTYYVDRGAPEPIRSALLEGARWWGQAFEAAGYKDAFRVELLPEGADPMDVRYNVIEWVHRATRGWAYGNALADPRTGEILNGHVTLDSQRARHVFRLAEGLLASYERGKPPAPEIEQLVLARIRQLSAHEVGHTLGLAHNFAASARGRASVMDYPHPLIRLKADGSFDASGAYATGVGEWDKVAIAYGYREFAPGADERAELGRILAGARAKGLVFVTDTDARPAGSAHPLAHLWDNGADAVAELERVLRVRARALERFSAKSIPVGEPLSTLEDRLVLVYLFHRYQLAAAAKLVGGVSYTYAVRGDGDAPPRVVEPDDQRRALEAVLRTLHPDTLALPERVLRLLPPPAYGHERTADNLAGRTGVTFDALAGPEAAAGLTVGLLLEPTRAARLVEQHARDDRSPGLAGVLGRLLEATWRQPAEKGYRGEVRRVVNQTVLYHLMALAANEGATAQVRALAHARLEELKGWLETRLKQEADAGQRAHQAFALARIVRFLREPARPSLPRPAAPPPGQPIGAPPCAGCCRHGLAGCRGGW